MRNTLLMFALLSSFIFYGINKNAVKLKEKFGKLESSVIASGTSLDNKNYQFAIKPDSQNNKVVCVLINGVIYCHDS
ncbi:MAG: hypothetical protein M3421_07740 [Bacteroidota bacterium]|jgi:hypothetical protein|nr:hypothetical protein [Bacteroidota bacterium]